MKQTKQCITCEEIKPLEDFPIRPKRSDGREGECKACRSVRRKTGDGYLKERLRKHYYRSKGEGHLTIEQLREIEKGTHCTYCGCELSDNTRVVDHVFPLGQWWSMNSAINMVLCCKSCNSSKSDSHVYDFYQRSDKFTPELWGKFVSDFAERAIGHKPTAEEVKQWSEGFELEAKELKERVQRA
ncbi:HNH endonuclease [Rummeliibacillus suwonensis]|uniref:HNH endonuclease n=1 Tax=Rummeliibacillus suwonensis TaxID=1306154 RepID=UPI00164526F8|nr:HNH endonuclease [Rummeliibacillus suwonensis]